MRGEAQKIESGMEMRNEPMGHVKIALMLLGVKLYDKAIPKIITPSYGATSYDFVF